MYIWSSVIQFYSCDFSKGLSLFYVAVAETALFSPATQLSSSWALIIFPAFLGARCEHVLYSAHGYEGTAVLVWPQLFRSCCHSSTHSFSFHGLGADNNKALKGNSHSRWKNALSLHHHKEENQLWTSITIRTRHLMTSYLRLCNFECICYHVPACMQRVSYFHATNVIKSRLSFFTCFISLFSLKISPFILPLSFKLPGSLLFHQTYHMSLHTTYYFHLYFQ